MSSTLNTLGVHDGGFNIVIALFVAVILVAVLLLLKISARKSETTNKSQSAKKLQKINKEKHEKPISIKQDKINKEIKISASSVKALDISGDIDKTKTNKKQPVANEKSPKKNIPTKKQQVNNNTPKIPTKNYQSNKKQLESLISNDEEGEWQMVTTKKQKQAKQDELSDAYNDKVKKTQNTPENFKLENKTKKVKIVNEKGDISTQIVNSGKAPSEIKQIVEAESSLYQEIDSPLFGTCSSNQMEISAVESYLSNKDASIRNSEDINDAIGELADDGWTDTKPQKKNRRKALRE